MSEIDRLVANNAAYAATHPGPLPVQPSARLAIVACMDARVDVYGALGLVAGEAHVIRNAGGMVTEAELRSLAVSQRKLGTREIMVVHHTDCGMLGFEDEAFKDKLEAETGVRPAWPADDLGEIDENLRAIVARIKASPFLVHTDQVRAFVLDVANGRISEVVVEGAFPKETV